MNTTNTFRTFRGYNPTVSLSNVEKQHILKALEHFNNNKSQTARSLGVSLKTLYNKLHQYGIIKETTDELQRTEQGFSASGTIKEGTHNV